VGLAIRASLSASCRGWCAAQQVAEADQAIEYPREVSFVFAAFQVSFHCASHKAADAPAVRRQLDVEGGGFPFDRMLPFCYAEYQINRATGR